MVSITKKSWIDIPKDCDFSLDNIPFGVCSFPSTLKSCSRASSYFYTDLPSLSPETPRCCTAIGNYSVDLHLLAEAGLFDELSHDGSNKCQQNIIDFHPRVVFSQSTLNDFMACEKNIWIAVRNRLISLFIESNDQNNGMEVDSRLQNNVALQKLSMHSLTDTVCHLPAAIGDYTDFYSSREHATNVGIMFRGPENALQPNWLHMPIGYHGRSSSIFPSGSGENVSLIRRPCGQLQIDPTNPKEGSTYGACKLLDFELEVAFFVGGYPNYIYSVTTGNSEFTKIGRPMTIEEAKDRIFGYVLMNDWSARDIQKWEYVPLGPFTSKNFATTISTWVITTMALENFRCETSSVQYNDDVEQRISGQCDSPIPLEYLQDPDYGSYDVTLSVSIQPSILPRKIAKVSQSNLKHLYWSSAQQLVHHSVTGCPMNPGDLLASGTISGPERSNFGSMLELSWKGTQDIVLDFGLGDLEHRKFLEDGDTVIMNGFCKKEGLGRVGFGECSAMVLPANPYPYNAEEQLLKPSNQPRFTCFKLHGCLKSASTRTLCIALRAKGVLYEMVPSVSADKQQSTVNCGVDCTLEFVDRGTKTVFITQTLAIIDFLEYSFSEQGGRLLPKEPLARSKVKELADIIIAPWVNSGEKFGKESIEKRLFRLEALLAPYHLMVDKKTAGAFAIGSFGPTLVDACLVPELSNARMLGLDVDSMFPTIFNIEKACNKHLWFQLPIAENT